MSETEEIELSKEERLEAARKKFEELKKKNKKKSKKGKKLKKDEDDKEDTPGVEDDEEVSKPDDIEALEELEPEDTKEIQETEGKVETTTTASDEIEPALESTEDSGTGKTWLDEIQAAQPTEPIESPEAIIARQKTEIQELKEENTDLRMNKFELIEKIESLEATIKRLNAKLNSRLIDRPLYQSDYNSELSLSPDPPLFLSTHGTSQPPSQFIQTPSFSGGIGGDYADSAGDLRDRLLKWKGWQVDMRSWRSIAAGPVVEI